MTRRRAQTLAASCFGGGLAVLVGAYLLLVRTAAGQRLDARLTPTRGFGPATHLLASFDRHIELAEAVILVAVVLTAVRRGQLWRGLLCAAMPLVLAVEAQAMQDVLPRPDFGGLDATIHNSFPSGHVALVAATVIAVVLVLPGRVRLPVALVGGAAVTLMMGATMAADWHRFSDGLGAIALAVAGGGAVVLAAPTIRRPDESPQATTESGRTHVLV